MKSIFLLPAGLSAVFALSVHAQPPVSAPSADPADATYSASAPAYHSAFDGYQKSAEMRKSVRPSSHAWRAANDAVSKSDMHAGHMQMPSSDAKSQGDASHADHANHQTGHQANHQTDHQTAHPVDRNTGHDTEHNARHGMHQHHQGGGK